MSVSSQYNLFLVAGVGLISTIELLAITLIVLFREGDNSEYFTLIIGVGLSFQGFIGALLMRDNHSSMNSRLDQMDSATARAERSEGRAEGIASAEGAKEKEVKQ